MNPVALLNGKRFPALVNSFPFWNDLKEFAVSLSDP
jgi:hypothetical protein